jgi:hypothetical protein
MPRQQVNDVKSGSFQRTSAVQSIPPKPTTVAASTRSSAAVKVRVTTLKPKTSIPKNSQTQPKKSSLSCTSTNTDASSENNARLKREMETLLNEESLDSSEENIPQNVATKSKVEFFKTPAHLKGKNVPNSVKKRINEIEALLQE